MAGKQAPACLVPLRQVSEQLVDRKCGLIGTVHATSGGWADLAGSPSATASRQVGGGRL
jgi:hypothetical protein